MKKFVFGLMFLFVLDAHSDDQGGVGKQLEPFGFVYGFGFGVNKEIYRGYDRRVIPLPVIGYRSERLNIYGPFASYDVATLGDFDFFLQVAPRFQGFDESDSNAFTGMEKRKFSMDAGVGAKYRQGNWNTKFSYLRDILDRSDGNEVSITLGRAFQKGPLFYQPSISVSHLSKNHVNYYYGVGTDESNASRPSYKAGSAFNTSLGFSISTPLFFEGFTQLAINYTSFDDAITNSPIVDDKSNVGLRILFSKYF